MKIGKVSELIRQKSSIYGNPRYLVIIQNDDGTITSAYTKTNYSLGYSVPNYDGRLVTYDVKMYRGKLTLTEIEAV